MKLQVILQFIFSLYNFLIYFLLSVSQNFLSTFYTSLFCFSFLMTPFIFSHLENTLLQNVVVITCPTNIFMPQINEHARLSNKNTFYSPVFMIFPDTDSLSCQLNLSIGAAHNNCIYSSGQSVAQGKKITSKFQRKNFQRVLLHSIFFLVSIHKALMCLTI